MYADAFFHDEPRWSRRPGRRLAVNLLPATIIVLGGLAVLRLPAIELSLPMTELIVRILVEGTEQVVESPFVDVTPTPAEATPESTGANAAPIPSPVVTESRTCAATNLGERTKGHVGSHTASQWQLFPRHR